MKKVASKYKLLLDAGFGEKLTTEYANLMNAAVDKENAHLYYSNVYWAGAISTVISEWIRNDMITPADTIAEIGAR